MIFGISWASNRNLNDNSHILIWPGGFGGLFAFYVLKVVVFVQITPNSPQSFQVADLQLLAENIYRVILRPHQGAVPDFRPGQYLEIMLDDGRVSAFSIASPPGQKELELHIQKVPASTNSIQLFNELERGYVQVRMPKGRCFLPAGAESMVDRPLVFIAASTGFAQMKSMIEVTLAASTPPDIYLYWGASSPAGFYLPNLPIYWASPYFHYHPVVSGAMEKDGWQGRQGLLFEAVIDDKDNFTNGEIFISGSPQMVYATFDALLACHFRAEQIHSDVFEYAPRS